MSRRASIVTALLLLLIGLIFTLQGIGILGGSSMTGSSFWAWIGGLCIVISLILFMRLPSGRK